jgi:tetratricopeptide (TPR) repeat protein/tRNA A-37 threonylcarbamoyl transferase component Bud32
VPRVGSDTIESVSSADHQPARAQSLSDVVETIVDLEERSEPDRGLDDLLHPGQEVGRYTVLERLGAGAMGIVFAAYDPELDRRVAVKLLRPSARDRQSTDGRARLLREAQALARLSHPNVVAVHDVGTHHDEVFVAMEYVSGLTLRAWRDEGRSWREVLEVFMAAGRGLAAAHEAGLIHRDFKPDNVMIDRHGRVRVMDFGLARSGAREQSPSDERMRNLDDIAILEDVTPATQTGRLMGTPAYMAPEQHLGLPADGRADQFAFCVSLWEALYGRRPFSGPTLAALGLAITNGKITEPPPGPRVPPWIRRVLERGLATKAEARFDSMEALLESLARDPARRRRRLLLAGGAVALLAGSVALGRAWDESASSICAGSAAELRAVWNPARERAIADRFTTLSAADGPEAWRHAAVRVREFGRGWARMREEACVATRVRAEQSELVMERRMACLDERLGSLNTALSVFEDADESTVAHAVEVVSELPTVGTCADVTALRRGLPPPSTPELALRVAQARASIDRARTLARAGRAVEADSALDAVEGLALPYPPLAAELLLQRGDTALSAGRYEVARVALHDAFFSAVRARHDEAGARAAARLVYLFGYRDPDFAEARRWAEHAAAIGERVGALSLTHADVLHSIGVMHDASGDAAAARAHYQASYTIRQQELDPGHPALAHSLNNLGNTMMDSGEFAEGLKHYRAALEIRREAFGDNHPIVAASWNNVGLGELEVGDLDAAVEALRRAHAVEMRTLGPEHPSAAVSTNNLGRMLINAGDPTEALPLIEQALAVRVEALGPTHPDTADSQAARAHALLALGRAAEARPSIEQALVGHARGLGENHPTVGYDLALSAAVLHALGDEATAREQAERAVKLTAGQQRDHDYAVSVLASLRPADAELDTAP